MRLVNATWTIPPVAGAELVGRVIEWIAEENARAQQLADEAANQLSAAGLRVSTSVREQERCAEAESMQAACIFCDGHGLKWLERVLPGSVSAGVAARAHCSVELVRD